MEKLSVFGQVLDRLASEQVESRTFDELECAVLKTMLMLSAVDGNVSTDEIDRFREQAMKLSGFTAEEFASIWRAALHSAGYLEIQARLLRKDDLVVEFLNEAESVFVPALLATPRVRWTKAFDSLNAISGADGIYSDVEKACVNALVSRVRALSKG